MFYKTDNPFTVLPYCISLSILPFDFSFSLLLSLWPIKEPGIQAPIRWLFWGASLPSSQSSTPLFKYLPCLNSLSLGFIGLLCSKQSEIWLGNNGCILSTYLFNFYAENIMRNAGLVEAQAGIKFAGRNINNLRYADDNTLMAESKEE